MFTRLPKLFKNSIEVKYILPPKMELIVKYQNTDLKFAFVKSSQKVTKIRLHLY